MKEVGISSVFAYNGFHMAKDEAKRKPGERSKGDGREDRFLKAFDEYADALFRHASYRISDRERATDVVHDTFTKVWGYLRGGYEIESYKPFLYKVLNNLIIDEYRRRKDISLDAILDEEGNDEGMFDDLSAGSIEEVTFSLDAKLAAELLHDMPPVYKEVLVLRFIDGLGPKEISELIEETENVVSVRIHRGLKLLKSKIDLAEERAETKRIEKQ